MSKDPNSGTGTLRVDHTLVQMDFLADIGLTPSEARDVSTFPGFINLDLDLESTTSWVFAKERLGLSAYEVAKVFFEYSTFCQFGKGYT